MKKVEILVKVEDSHACTMQYLGMSGIVCGECDRWYMDGTE